MFYDNIFEISVRIRDEYYSTRAKIMHILKKPLIIFAIFLLAACGGGGGGSSDGAGSTGGGTAIDLSRFAGVYSGTITATVTTSEGSETFTENITFDVTDDGDFITVESQRFALSNQSFSIPVAFPLAAEGVVCTLSVAINGNLGDDIITGTVNGNGDCVSSGATMTGEISGYFDAARG